MSPFSVNADVIRQTGDPPKRKAVAPKSTLLERRKIMSCFANEERATNVVDCTSQLMTVLQEGTSLVLLARKGLLTRAAALIDKNQLLSLS
jgi:hypothetical protein